jgi:hypothetical protein
MRNWRPKGTRSRRSSWHLYQRFWLMLEDELIIEVLNAVNSGVILDGWNNTSIVMIPKVDNHEKVTQFRP